MGTICRAITSRLDLVFFFYGLSFSAMGLLLFVQPKKETSFKLADSLWLLGWFGAIHGANEFLDMWTLLHPGPGRLFELIRVCALFASFAFLMEFARRTAATMGELSAPWKRLSPALTPFLTPALAAAALLPAVISGDFLGAAPGLTRLFMGFPAAALSGAVLLGYAACRRGALQRLNARFCFLLAGWAFIIYAVLAGLVPAPAPHFPASLFDTGTFAAATGLPVQLLRAFCAIAIFGSAVGIIRIFREGALQAAQQELLDIIEFFPDATFVINKDRKVIAWNRALEKMTGVPKAEMLDKGDFAYSIPFYGERRPIIIDLIGEPHPEAEKLYKFVKKREDGAVYAEVFVPSLYNGAGAHVWVTASPLIDKDGSVYGAIESIRDITDRKQAEDALHRSEAQYRALIETTNTGFLIIDGKGRVLDANQEYVRLSGHISLEEIRGRSVEEWTAPHDKERNRQAVENCKRSGCIRNFEVEYAAADGALTPIELNATVVDIGGEKRILTLCRDITDRKLAEKKLKESEGLFRSLSERSLVGVYLIQDGLFKYVNPKMAEIFGYRAHEMTDKIGPEDTVTAADWPTVRENLRQRLDGEASDINYSFHCLRKDGGGITVEVYGSRTEYLGRPAVLGTLVDITQRQKDQDALRESEERYRTLVDNAQVGIVVHHAGIMRFVNKKMAAIIGAADPAAVLGQSVVDFMHPDYREFVSARMMKAMEEGPQPPAEEKLLALDGAILDVEINTVPITYRGEKCAMAIVQDISGRKKAERDLLKANVELEKRVEERTRQLEEANKELEAFSYSAAHDMKAPLRRVNIFAEMLLKEAAPLLTGEAQEYLRNIRKSVTQMSALVQGLLTLSTTGRKPLELEPVPLSELAEECIAEVKAETTDHEVQWKAAQLPVVNCDRAMIKQVFLNLLGNAAKYTRGKEGAQGEIFYEFAHGEHVIGVRDNGIGFGMEHAGRIFDVFQRLHKADEFEGTGIGLSTVRRIVVRHGGRTWAESSPGRGATFYFTLPAGI
jgi:PAS domain S-box-containing protein